MHHLNYLKLIYVANNTIIIIIIIIVSLLF
jgi:hypothetical protein